MERREFIRGQKVFKEGSTKVNGLYFIINGQFEITQSVDPAKKEAAQMRLKKALSKSTNSASDLSRELQIGSRSNAMLKKLNQRSNLSMQAQEAINSNIKILHLVILGKNE